MGYKQCRRRFVLKHNLLATVAKATHESHARKSRSAKNPGINQALSNAYLKSQELYALRDGWINQASSWLMKRSVRSRMQGVVGAGG